LISRTESSTEMFIWDMNSQPPHRIVTDSPTPTIGSKSLIWTFDNRWIRVQHLGNVRRVCHLPAQYGRILALHACNLPDRSRLAIRCTGDRAVILDIQHLPFASSPKH
jgi:hypothetical protein